MRKKSYDILDNHPINIERKKQGLDVYKRQAKNLKNKEDILKEEALWVLSERQHRQSEDR